MMNTPKQTEKNHRRSDEALRHITALIFEGHLSPGSRLPSERELSETLGISRTTLRDALNRLEARGFIERRSKSGNYVCTAIPQSLRDPIENIIEANVVTIGEVIEIRKILEIWAAEKAARLATQESLQALNNCVKTMKRNSAFRTPAQFTRYSEADLKFHQIITEMTQNSIYVHLFHFFTNLISGSISLSQQMFPCNFAEQNLEVHKRIYQAIKDRNTDLAKQTMREHFNFVEKHVNPKK